HHLAVERLAILRIDHHQCPSKLMLNLYMFPRTAGTSPSDVPASRLTLEASTLRGALSPYEQPRRILRMFEHHLQRAATRWVGDDRHREWINGSAKGLLLHVNSCQILRRIVS